MKELVWCRSPGVARDRWRARAIRVRVLRERKTRLRREGLRTESSKENWVGHFKEMGEGNCDLECCSSLSLDEEGS